MAEWNIKTKRDKKSLNIRWLLVYGYVGVLFGVTPWLPGLIKWAGSIWSDEAVRHSVLIVEVVLGALLMVLAGGLFFGNRRRFLPFVLVVVGIMAMGYGFYCIVPNPYELIHLPEYAVLTILLFMAVRGSFGKSMPNRRLYFVVGGIAMGISAADELFQGILPNRFFGWRDFGLNGLGVVLGLMVVWAWMENSGPRLED